MESPWGEVYRQLSLRIEAYEIVALGMVAGLVLLATLFYLFDRRGAIQEWLRRNPQQRSQYDPYLPDWILWCASFGLLIAFSALGCFLYYPPEHEVFEEIKSANLHIGSAALSQDWKTADHWIPVAEDWLHKLAVSGHLRGRRPTPYLEAKRALLMEKLELLEHAVEDGEVEEAKRLGLDCQTALRRLRSAYIDTWPDEIPLKK